MRSITNLPTSKRKTLNLLNSLAKSKEPQCTAEATRHVVCILYDAGECQKYYLSNVLKKPQRVMVRYFFQHVAQLNNYLAHLPCIYDSLQVSTTTETVIPFSEGTLETHLLQMCPLSWQDQYSLVMKAVPKNHSELLTILKNIKECKKQVSQKAAKEQSGRANGKNNKKAAKQKGMQSPNNCIPKKACRKKHWALCKQHGGAHMTHNITNCWKYKKDGTQKKGFQGKSSKTDKKYKNVSFAQLSKRFAKLEKVLKKQSKKSSCKKCRYESDSSDSDSD